MAAGLLFALAACGPDRAEGVVERWLQAISQGPTGEPQIYSSNKLADEIVPRPRPASALEVIEVGKGSSSGREARVPYRVMRPKLKEEFGVAELRRSGSSWRIVDLLPKDPALKVPTEGGERIGKAKSVDWLAAAGAGLLLMILVAGIMRLVPTKT
jgi:hypothetical protein